MRYAHSTLRLGSTAIAAALALTSTSLLAQAPDAGADAAPVVMAPPPPTVTAPPAVTTAAPAQGGGLSSVTIPRITLDEAPAPAAEPSAASAAPAAAATRTVTRSTRTVARTTAPTPAVAERAAAPAPVVQPAPVAREVAPPITPAAAPLPPAVVAAPEAPSAQTRSNTVVESNDELLPIAGAAGLSLIVLAGGAYALGRRKRRDGDVFESETPLEPVAIAPAAPRAADPVLVPTPAPLASSFEPAVARSAPTSAEPNRLPNGFDLSRFGPHVQAAYRGPTEDNPSFSLKRRLRRGAALDQRERIIAEGNAPVVTREESVAPIARPAPRANDRVVARPIRRPGASFRPVFQG